MQANPCISCDPAWEMRRDPASSSGDGAHAICTPRKVCYHVCCCAETYLSVAVRHWQQRCSWCGMEGSTGTAKSHQHCSQHTHPLYRRRGRRKPGSTAVAPTTATGTVGKWSRVSTGQAHCWKCLLEAPVAVKIRSENELLLQVTRSCSRFIRSGQLEPHLSDTWGSLGHYRTVTVCNFTPL